MRLENRADLPEPDLRSLEREVLGHRSLIDALAYAGRQGHGRLVPKVVVQDEYSHDVVVAWRGAATLVYAAT